MRDIHRRIDAIQRKAEQVMEARARYEPFSVIRIRSTFDDKADAIFYPCGLCGEKEVSGITSIPEAIDTARDRRIYISMSLCREWWHAFLMTSPLYSDEQKANFKERALHNYSEIAVIALIYDDPNPEECIRFLSKIPKSFRLRKDAS